jgi:hypothetical protein
MSTAAGKSVRDFFRPLQTAFSAPHKTLFHYSFRHRPPSHGQDLTISGESGDMQAPCRRTVKALTISPESLSAEIFELVGV